MPVGNTVTKKIKPKTIGVKNFPKINPNLSQALFKGVNIFDLIAVNNKNITLIIKGKNFIFSLFNNGHKPIIKKIIVKRIPKLLSEPVLIFFVFMNKG